MCDCGVLEDQLISGLREEGRRVIGHIEFKAIGKGAPRVVQGGGDRVGAEVGRGGWAEGVG